MLKLYHSLYLLYRGSRMQSMHARILWALWYSSKTALTSISLAGPLCTSRLSGLTGTASKVSFLSPPSLCWLQVRILPGSDFIKMKLTPSTASMIISIPFALATLQAWRNSSFVPHRVAMVPFWSNSPRSHWVSQGTRRQVSQCVNMNKLHTRS